MNFHIQYDVIYKYLKLSRDNISKCEFVKIRNKIIDMKNKYFNIFSQKLFIVFLINFAIAFFDKIH